MVKVWTACTVSLVAAVLAAGVGFGSPADAATSRAATGTCTFLAQAQQQLDRAIAAFQNIEASLPPAVDAIGRTGFAVDQQLIQDASVRAGCSHVS